MSRRKKRPAKGSASARVAAADRPTHNFTLVLSGVADLTDELADAVYEAGCDDALLGKRHGVVFLEFDREAATLPEAVLSAVHDLESVEGVDLLRVEPDDLVTASEIARRTGRSRESIRLLSTGMRGPGGFPPPVHSLRGQSPLWRWAEVAEWVDEHLSDSRIPPQEWESAAFIAVLNSALQIHHLVPSMSVMSALWTSMNRWQEKKITPRYAWLHLLRESKAR